MMIKVDEAALICDFAETYHIYDYKELPASKAALLAVGLRDDSRIKSRLSGAVARPDIILMTAILDQLRLLMWSKTKDAEKGRNMPKSILAMVLNQESTSNTEAYASGEDFEKARNQLLSRR